MCNIHDFINDNNLLPYALKITESDLIVWLNQRFIPKNRRFVESILEALVVTGEQRIISLLKITLGLSLNDDYWVVSYDSDYKWDNYNLYDNEFSETLSLIAFTGHGSKIRGVVSSPEATTNGMLRKCWRRIDGKVYLYKGGTDGYANAGNEPYSEYYAYQIADIMGLNAVKYNLKKWKGILCSTCELFTSKDTAFIPAYKVYGDTPVVDILKMETGTVRDKLIDMMVFDAIVVNEDRHFNNFGFLRNNSTGELTDVAPIFDNGVSLLTYAMDNDLENVHNYLAGKQMTFAFMGATQLNIIKPYMTHRHKDIVRKLIGFEFTKHSQYNLSAKRLKILTKIVSSRISELLT